MRMYEPTDVPKDYVVLDCETTGKEPETYILTAVGIGSSPQDIEVSHIESDDEEPKLIRWVGEKLSSYDTREVIAWNAKFDFRFIRTRAMIRGEVDPLKGHEMNDDMLWFKKFTEINQGNYASLEHVARVLKIGAKTGKGHEMPRLYHEGKYDQIAKHCRKDVELTIRIHERILETEGLKSPELKKKESETVPTLKPASDLEGD